METATKTTLYNELFNAVSEHVKNYRTDLTEHDKKSVTEDSKTPFIHIAREHGTSLNRFFNSDAYPKKGERVKYLFGTANRKEILNSGFDGLQYYLKESPKCIHFFNGETLKKVTPAQALRHYSDYMRSLLYTWENEK